MLRRDIRLFIFAGCFILLIIALIQFQSSQDNDSPTNSKFMINPALLNQKKDKGRNLKSIPSNTNTKSKSYPLRDYVIRDIKQFMFFVGYARSGHSIVASLLDAHPNVVISHEYSLFKQWTDEPMKHSDKSWLFNTLYESSKTSAEKGLRTTTAKKKGYSLAVPGWYQGSYDGIIDIIGDKSGGLTAQVFRKSEKTFKSLYQDLRNTVQIPIKAIHVVRNPYDNIATMLLYGQHIKRKVNETNKLDDVDALRTQITSYFNQVRSVVQMIKDIPLDAIEIHNSDLIANPKKVMRELCSRLSIECSAEYLHMCAETVFVSESLTRHLVTWTPELIEMVADNMEKYKHLQRYSFE